ncbi:type II toxin-antitoxin system HicB family antitoxin [Acidihalobacter ferrooxydans]|uniref:Toxin-antitoxin system HicB family antitoxin n=1 Tax=Acidihalobacter ferrooxydans TaxID=1765967 RepID=A0A1P8UFE5_9GAMM|nr:type II toxin-antitoxin system HicB family antitoxin [Acidihalobacter ferrooxydans]APZ42567.1 hypothetical protein BW247_05205 [Acidihalobacter ferrooxydans]
MNHLVYKGYHGSCELDMTRQVCRGKILFINDLVTYEADTPVDLQAAFEDAVEDYIQTCKQVGKEPQKPFRGQFNVRIPPQLHRAACLRAISGDVALNEVVVRALDAYVNGSSEVQHNHSVDLKISFSGAEPWKTAQTSTADVTSWLDVSNGASDDPVRH